MMNVVRGSPAWKALQSAYGIAEHLMYTVNRNRQTLKQDIHYPAEKSDYEGWFRQLIFLKNTH